jgi:2-oxoglutarate ferredoxin oxidoreductase subunit delta
MADKKRGRIKIKQRKMQGCYLCISVCPKHIIAVSEALNCQGYYPAKSTDNSDDPECTGCSMCATICPDVAIEVYRD